jgi:predicted ATPase
LLRREEVKLQVALINSLFHAKGYAAPETKAAVERARHLIEQAEALGEPPEDPLLLFSVLYGFWVASYVAFDGDMMHELAAQFLALAENQRETAPLMVGHRLMGSSHVCTGDVARGRTHLDKAFSLFNPAEHRSLATRFGQNVGVSILSYRALAQWMLGHPEAALADADTALKEAREGGHVATLRYALAHTQLVHTQCGNYATASEQLDEHLALTTEVFGKALGMILRGCVLALTGKASEAIQILTSGSAALRSTGSTFWLPLGLAYLARSYAELGKFDDAWPIVARSITAVETTRERWYEAEVRRIGGEIALVSPHVGAAEAEEYFQRALAVARQQQAKSWELRAAMSLARLWRSQGKVQQARELLAPVYGWFTEGFDTLDLKEAKALLGALAK